MKCPLCGEELKRSQKDPNYGLCNNCRKKFKWVDEFDEEDYEEVTATQHPSSPGYNYSEEAPKKKGGCLKVALVVIGVIIAIFIIGALFGEKDTVKDATSKEAATSETEEKEKKQEKTDFSIGEVAEYKNIQVSALSFEESPGNDWGTPAEGKTFVFVNMEITNNSSDEMSVSSMMSFEAYCGDYKLDYSSNALMAMSTDDTKSQLDGSIAPGKKMNGYLGLEVPANWQQIEIHYKDNVWLNSNFKFIINKNF